MPPYYAGTRMPIGSEGIGHLPLIYQSGPEQADMLDHEGARTQFAALLAEMNGYLNDLRDSAPLRLEIERGSGAPDVRFGCENRLSGDCGTEGGDGPMRKRWMRLAVDGPTDEWSDAVAAALEETGNDFLLVVTLETGEYWPMRKGSPADRAVRLGTGNVQRLARLTPLDEPIRVLQLTGAVLTAEGKAVRVGAEGVLARRTDLITSEAGGSATITVQDIRKLSKLRRDDLSGKPLVWQVALENLVRQLTGQGVIR